MNKDLFLRYIENDRDCKQNRLNIAVNRGISMAKNDRFDTKKLLMLAAAGVFSFALCFTVNFKPFAAVAEEYCRNWHKTMPGIAEILDGYINDIAGNVNKYLGG
jgi:hypothetical protein